MPMRESGPTRETPRWLLIVAAALLVARVATGFVEERPGPHAAAGAAIAWQPPGNELALARAHGRLVLYEFRADGSAPCERQEREVFADPEVAHFVGERYVAVRVTVHRREDGGDSGVVSKLAENYAIGTFPTLVVVDPAGGEFQRLEGYEGPFRAAKWLRDVAGPRQFRFQFGGTPPARDSVSVR